VWGVGYRLLAERGIEATIHLWREALGVSVPADA
jgi:hypothetical protein